jgi:L-methionine (R)-S-oxide reductase
MNLSTKYLTALEKIKEDASGVNIWRYMLPDIIYDLKNTFSKYSWVGIYLIDKDILLLDSFLGKSTEHTKIKFTEGICGACATAVETIIVGNVCEDNRYISCDLSVKSEIVVPIKKNNELIGVLDIDSDRKGIFTDEDKEFLEIVADLIGNTFPSINKMK